MDHIVREPDSDDMRRCRPSIVIRCLILFTIALTGSAGAQATLDTIAMRRSSGVDLSWHGVAAIDTRSVAPLRLSQLLGRGESKNLLLRSPSTLLETQSPSGGSVGVTVLTPELSSVWNSGIPFPSQSFPGWEGRGLNLLLTAGAAFRFGPVRLILAPQIARQDNAEFQTIVYPLSRVPQRNRYSSPFHGAPHSLDLPQRYGADGRTLVDLGQSSLSVGAGPVEVGVATENLWWGPGIRNALVMSNNARGFPHAFLRTSEGIETLLGDFEARWIVGELSESDYFDDHDSNNSRALSAAALVFRPAIEPDLSLGITRAVYSLEPGEGVQLTSPFDVFRDIGRPNAFPADTLQQGRAFDQVFSLFGQWLFPESGFETYAEWARFEQPRSPRDFFSTPNHTQGYTLGLQWAKAVAGGPVVQLQTELTNLELSSTYPTRRVISSYTSTVIPQGYTNRGQVIGANIGPGASSQWLAADLINERWNVGAFAGRIRWDNAAFYDVVPNATYLGHDVSLYAGVRGAVEFYDLELSTSLQRGMRYNYLFQNYARAIDDVSAVDIRNYTAEFTLRALH